MTSMVAHRVVSQDLGKEKSILWGEDRIIVRKLSRKKNLNNFDYGLDLYSQKGKSTIYKILNKKKH